MKDFNAIMEYQNPYGVWEVTTEGDCECKSTKYLGTYEGYIDEIALALADKCYYSLHFKKLDPQRLNMTPKKNKVNITLSIDSGTWTLKGDNRVKYFNNNILKDRPCQAVKADKYASVLISTDKETLEDKKKKALEKLTDEEKEILGL